MVDGFLKAIAILIGFLVTFWFLTTHNHPGAGREIIYISLSIPLAVYVAFQLLTYSLRHFLSASKPNRLPRALSPGQMDELARRVAREKSLLEREHPDMAEQLRNHQTSLDSIMMRADAIAKQVAIDPAAKREEAKRLFDELSTPSHPEQSNRASAKINTGR